jgi:ribose/xylose/arabinose/galactoside ABC-type transport system permease subunit
MTKISTETQAAAPDSPVEATRSVWSRLIGNQTLGLLGVVVLLVIIFSFASPYFLTAGNFRNILLSVAVIGTMAAVLTLVVVAGMLDLSIGSTAALTSVLSALLVASYGWNPFAAAGIGLVAGALAGLFNGFFVTIVRVNPIIVTIGTLSVFRGLAFITTGGKDVPVNDPISEVLGFGTIQGVPIAVIIMLVVFALTGLVAHQTTFGRNLYAIGANPKAARLSGIPMARTRIIILVAMGVVSAVAGIMLKAQAGAAVPSGATGYELQTLTAVLLGGASLQGGEGRITGTLVGVFLIGVINNGMTLLSVPSFYQTVASGLLLLVAVAIDQLRRGGGYR